MSKDTTRDLLTQDLFKNLNQDEKLAHITKTLPELRNHPVIDLFPRTSKETEESLEASLIMDGHKGTIYVSQEFELVKGSTIYKIIKKLHDAGETVKPRIVFCEDPVTTRRDLCFIYKKYNPNQAAAIIVKMSCYNDLRKMAKGRMGCKYPDMFKGRTTEIASRIYHVNRAYFELAWKIRKYDDDNGTNYLQFACDGKATLKQIDEELCGSLNPKYVEDMVVSLSNAEPTYENAMNPDALYDKNGKIKNSQKVGAEFSRLNKEWEINRRKEIVAKRKQETEESKENADIAKKIGISEEAPNSHVHKEPTLDITEDMASYNVEIRLLASVYTEKELGKVAIFFQKNKYDGKKFSIEFVGDNNKTKYLNVPALNIVNKKSLKIYHCEEDCGLA